MTSNTPAARPAAFFDLDKTVIATSSATAFARPFLRGGLLTRRAIMRSAFAQVAFLLGSANEGTTERLRVALSRTVAGWNVVRVEELIDQHVDQVISPVLYREAVQLIASHHAAGHEVVIVSASAEELVRPIARLLGVDHVIATRMETSGGCYTGRIDSYAYGEAKASAMRTLARERGYNLAASSAYTDSETDAPMLATVGHGFVVNPDPRLRLWAAKQGWQPLVFHRVGHHGTYPNTDSAHTESPPTGSAQGGVTPARIATVAGVGAVLLLAAMAAAHVLIQRANGCRRPPTSG